MYYYIRLRFIAIKVSGARDECSALRIGTGCVDTTFVKELHHVAEAY